MKKIRLFILIAVCGILTACGGGGGTTTTPDSFTPESKTQVVGPGGGSITHTLANGAVFQIDIPAGALTSDTTFTFTTQKPTEGQRFNYLLQPAGLVLANGAVATITITLPPGQTLPSTGGLVYDNALIPFTTLPDGRLQVSLSAFAGTTVSGAPKKAGKASSETLQNMISALYSPNANMASAVNTCSAPELDTNGGLSTVDSAAIEAYGQCMLSAINALVANQMFGEAIHTAQAVAAYMQRAGSSSDQYLTQASTLACTSHRTTLDNAGKISINGMSILYQVIKRVLYWEIVVQALGTSCPDIAPGEYQTVLHTKIDEALAYYSQQKPSLTDTTSSNYAEAKAEAAESAKAKNEVLALLATLSQQIPNAVKYRVSRAAPASGIRATVTSEISERAQPGLLDAMLQAPWERCRNTANYDELIYLMTTMDSPEAVKSAAQYCGTVVQYVQAKNASGTVTDQLAQSLGGISAGVTRTSDSIKVDKLGRLSFIGPIQALQCPSGQTGGSESLTVKIDGTTIYTFDSPPYLNNTLDMTLADALEAAHPGATASLTSATLTISRTGTPCNGFWGANPSPLLTLTLSMTQPKIVFLKNNDIYVINPDGSGETMFTSGIEDDRSPAWSPDRTKIAFTRGVNIYVMNADGSGITALTSSGTMYPSYAGPAWSPDGSKIAFIYYDYDGWLSNIYVMNQDGSGITNLTNWSAHMVLSYSPSWSPDGTKIAFSRFDYNVYDIYLMNTDGSGITKLTDSTASSSMPDWSPDGSKIVYSCGYGGFICVINVDGTGQKQLTSGNFSDHYPDWSPDGSKITFSRSQYPYGENIYIMNSDGTGVTMLTNGYSPAW